MPVYYANQNIRCQALHLLTPSLEIIGQENSPSGVFLRILVPGASEFASRLQEFDAKNLQQATSNKNSWWITKSAKPLEYQTSIKRLATGDIEWSVQIPESGIFSSYDTKRKTWFASNESGLQKRKWKIVVRTSGLWIDSTAFGMEWKLIGAFVI